MSDAGVVARRARPIVVQHSFGDIGSGGPIGALTRILESPLAEKYEFVRMHQDSATGGLDWARIRRWRDMLKEVKPDLVHVRGLGNEGLHGVLAARAAGSPRRLVSIHGTIRDLNSRRFKDELLVRVAEPLTLRLATHVTTVCQYAAERPFVQRHSQKFVGPLTNGVVLGDAASGLRSAARERLDLPRDSVIMISVGRLTWEKGHRELVEAIRGAENRFPRDTILLVVGDGPDSGPIRDAYATLGLEVRMLGRRLDVPDLLRAANLFVFPSLHENLSNALLEAMAAGLPVVATAVGGNTEVLRRGGGVLVPAADSMSLREAVVSMLSDVPEMDRLGDAAREVVEADYSVAAMCDRLDGVYQDILGGAPK